MKSFISKGFLLFLICWLCINHSYCQIDTTSFNTYIPNHDNPRGIMARSNAIQKANQLFLEDINKGYDSLQIRIWVNFFNSNERKVIVIRNRKNKWEGFLYTMETKWNFVSKGEDIISYCKYPITPKFGWDNLITNLNNDSINVLPDMYELLDGYLADCNSYSFEISNRISFRFYHYDCIEIFNTQYWQYEKAGKIIGVIEDEFEIDLGLRKD